MAASLALVSRLTAAHRNLVAAGPDDKQHREEVFHQLYAQVDADRVATLQVEVLDAENRRGLARAEADPPPLLPLRVPALLCKQRGTG